MLFLFFLSSQLSAQKTAKKKFKDIAEISGYLKFLPSVVFTDGDNLFTDNLIHNRINTKFFLSDKFTAKVDFRTRIFYGELVRANPFYADNLTSDTGEIAMSLIIFDRKSVVMHSIIDRANLNYISGNWDITLGRQRINWGVNLAWNANDLFNAYSFTNFDYEERPGSDAIRIQYFTGESSNLDFAYRFGKKIDESVIAGLFKFNKWKYDFQFLAANYYKDVALGLGWAGNLRKAGFKGEATYFHPKENFADSDGVLSAATSVDYSFKKGLYLNGSFLLNTSGSNKPFELLNGDISNLSFLGEGNAISAKSLMPSKFSYFIQMQKIFNPTISGSLAIIYGQGMNLFFLMPNVTYSIKEDWDIDLTGQITYLEIDDTFKNRINSLFLRLRYSY